MRFAKLRNENGMRVAHPEQIECSSVTFQHDTGEAVARQLDRLLESAGLRGGGQGRLSLSTSGAPVAVTATVNRLFGRKLSIEHWEP